MILFRFLLVVAAVLLLPACSAGGRIMNALQPDEGVSVERGIGYGSLPRQKYDLYSPADAKPDTPVTRVRAGSDGFTRAALHMRGWVG